MTKFILFLSNMKIVLGELGFFFSFIFGYIYSGCNYAHSLFHVIR